MKSDGKTSRTDLFGCSHHKGWLVFRNGQLPRFVSGGYLRLLVASLVAVGWWPVENRRKGKTKGKEPVARVTY